MAIIDNYENYFDLMIRIRDAIKIGYNSIDKIYIYLSKKYSKEEIRYCLNKLLVDDESIIRNDFYYKQPEYETVNDRARNSNYTKHYRSFIDDNPEKPKKILLISDTHIGNNNLENMDLIRTIYDYAEQNNCDYVFHQGDLFEGNSPDELETFIRNYPNNLKTICIMGNHDKKIKSPKYLNYYNDSFNFYETDCWETSINNIPIHLSHRLYISWILEDKRIESINDLDNVKNWISNIYNFLISGHLHQGIIYSENNYENKQVFYIGVPSLSNININKSVAYILDIDNNFIHITVLSSDSNLHISEIDNIDLDINNTGKTLKKIY